MEPIGKKTMRAMHTKYNLEPAGKKAIRYPSTKRRSKSNPTTYYPQAQNKDVLFYPVNPDSKPQLQALQTSNTPPPKTVKYLNP